MTKHSLTPQARRAEDTSPARAETRKMDGTVALWPLAALVLTGIVALALI
jgi:hypothetical protein